MLPPVSWETPVGDLSAVAVHKEAFSSTIVATSGLLQKPSVTYKLIDPPGFVPAGVFQLSSAGEVTGTPVTKAPRYTFSASATDFLGRIIVRDFGVVVVAHDPIWVTAAGLGRMVHEEPVNRSLTAMATSNRTGASLMVTYSEVSEGALAAVGLTLDSSSGTIVGAPIRIDTLSQTHRIVVRATDALGRTADKAFTLTVISNTPPYFTGNYTRLGVLYDAGRANFDELASLKFVDDEQSATALSYSLSTGALPLGVNLTVTGTFEGEAEAVTADTEYSFTVACNDGVVSAARPFTLIVKAPTYVSLKGTGQWVAPFTGRIQLVAAGAGGAGGSAAGGSVIHHKAFNITRDSRYDHDVGFWNADPDSQRGGDTSFGGVIVARGGSGATHKSGRSGGNLGGHGSPQQTSSCYSGSGTLESSLAGPGVDADCFAQGRGGTSGWTCPLGCDVACVYEGYTGGQSYNRGSDWMSGAGGGAGAGGNGFNTYVCGPSGADAGNGGKGAFIEAFKATEYGDEGWYGGGRTQCWHNNCCRQAYSWATTSTKPGCQNRGSTVPGGLHVARGLEWGGAGHNGTIVIRY